MKKLITFLVIIMTLLFAFTGCGSNQASKQDSQNEERQSFRQGEPADLVGEVDTITDNNVTLKLIEMPTRPNGGSNGDQNRGSNRQPSRNPDEKRPNGANGNGQQGSQPRNWGDRQVKYTGQSETLTISNDLPITTFARGDNGPKTENLKLSDIKKGDRLQVYYSDKEKKAIKSISVMPQRNNQQQN